MSTAQDQQSHAALLPCAHCGSTRASTQNQDPDHLTGGYYIECQDCGASTGLRFACGEDPKPLLVEQWNRRAPVDQTARALPAGMTPAHTQRHEDICGNEVGPPDFFYSAAQVQAMGRVPPGWLAVERQLLEDAEQALANFVSEHDWGDSDMAAMDNLSAVLAAAPRPPATQEHYRLLVRGVDTIQASDEFLRDDAVTWQPDPTGTFVGMTYVGNVLLPARRAVEPTP